ncbi:MAG: SAM-dependent methyltransferase, partial [Methylococcaceae bacterium]|nr:SAM-dependent methyltransferase [Methylococcaceae bacterium]
MPQASPFPLRVSIALVSAAALGYELLLMRWFSMIQWHHFAFMIISLALLGFGVSGTVLSLFSGWLERHFSVVMIANLLLFAGSSVGALALAQRVPFNAEELLWNWRQSLYLLRVYLLLMCPFFFAANSIGLSFLRYRKGISGIYAADLAGAGFGSFGMVILLFYIFPETAVLVVSLTGVLAAAASWWALNRESSAWLIASIGCGCLLYFFPQAWIHPVYSPYKGLSQALRIPGNRIVFESSSPLGRISILESQITPIRHAPGVSLNASGEIPEQIGVYIDADSLSVINRIDEPRKQDWLDQATSALPFHFRHFDRVLIPGAGTGGEVLRALYHQSGHIDAVELNPAIIGLLEDRFAGFSGDLYHRDNVTIHVADARGFAEGQAAEYDLIQLGLLDSMGSSAGLQALGENYLYTVEALKTFLGRLTPQGVLALSLWTKIPPRDTLKMFATAVQALKDRRVPFPGRQLILIRGWQTSTLIVKNGMITGPEITRTLEFCKDRSFDPVYFPGIHPEQTNRYNKVREDYFFLGSHALLSEHSSAFQRDYKFNIEAARDDKPYFFDFFKWRSLPEIISSLGSGGISLLESGYLILMLTLVQAILASMVLILLPLRVAKKRSGDTPMHKVLAYFFPLGVAFMFLEIALIQKFILFLHHPLYAITATLSTILICAGMGSRWAQRFDSPESRFGAVRYSTAAILSLGLAFALGLNSLLVELVNLSQPVKFLIAALLLAPPGFFMGIPFPLGL